MKRQKHAALKNSSCKIFIYLTFYNFFNFHWFIQIFFLVLMCWKKIFLILFNCPIHFIFINNYFKNIVTEYNLILVNIT